MNNQEAIQRIKEHIAIHKYRESHAIHIVEALEMAISALEKQIPKRVIAEGNAYADGAMVYDTFYCPSCDHCMEEDELQDYCPNCGQKFIGRTSDG